MALYVINYPKIHLVQSTCIFLGSEVSCAQLGGSCMNFLIRLQSNGDWGWSHLEVLTHMSDG